MDLFIPVQSDRMMRSFWSLIWNLKYRTHRCTHLFTKDSQNRIDRSKSFRFEINQGQTLSYGSIESNKTKISYNSRQCSFIRKKNEEKENKKQNRTEQTLFLFQLLSLSFQWERNDWIWIWIEPEFGHVSVLLIEHNFFF